MRKLTILHEDTINPYDDEKENKWGNPEDLYEDSVPVENPSYEDLYDEPDPFDKMAGTYGVYEDVDDDDVIEDSEGLYTDEDDVELTPELDSDDDDIDIDVDIEDETDECPLDIDLTGDEIVSYVEPIAEGPLEIDVPSTSVNVTASAGSELVIDLDQPTSVNLHVENKGRSRRLRKEAMRADPFKQGAFDILYDVLTDPTSDETDGIAALIDDGFDPATAEYYTTLFFDENYDTAAPDIGLDFYGRNESKRTIKKEELTAGSKIGNNGVSVNQAVYKIGGKGVIGRVIAVDDSGNNVFVQWGNQEGDTTCESPNDLTTDGAMIHYRGRMEATDISLNREDVLDNVPTQALKTALKADGINLQGTESDDEVEAMVFALASKEESFKRRINKLIKLHESTKNWVKEAVDLGHSYKSLVEMYKADTAATKVSHSAFTEWVKSFVKKEEYEYKNDNLDDKADECDDDDKEDDKEILVEKPPKTESKKYKSKFIKQ